MKPYVPQEMDISPLAVINNVTFYIQLYQIHNQYANDFFQGANSAKNSTCWSKSSFILEQAPLSPHKDCQAGF